MPACNKPVSKPANDVINAYAAHNLAPYFGLDEKILHVKPNGGEARFIVSTPAPPKTLVIKHSSLGVLAFESAGGYTEIRADDFGLLPETIVLHFDFAARSYVRS